MRQVGDAAFRAAHLRDDARVAVEERRVGQGVPARRRIAGRRPERTENAVHLGALHAGRHQVVVVEVLQPAADAVVALAGRGARSRRLLAGVGEEDVDQPRIGAERAVRAGDGGAAAAGEEVVDRDGGAAEPALGAVTARARLHVGALRRSVLEDVDVARERADAPPSRAWRPGADVVRARRHLRVRVRDGHPPVHRAARIGELAGDVVGSRGERGLLVRHRRRVVDDPEEIDLHRTRGACSEEQRDDERRDDACACGPRDRLHRSPSPCRRMARTRIPVIAARARWVPPESGAQRDASGRRGSHDRMIGCGDHARRASRMGATMALRWRAR